MFNENKDVNIKHNIKTLPKAKELSSSFRQRFDARHAVQEWIDNPLTKKAHLDCKRRSVSAALTEFRKLNDVTEFYLSHKDQNANWKDDSLEIHYRVKA